MPDEIKIFEGLKGPEKKICWSFINSVEPDELFFRLSIKIHYFSYQTIT
jgi:hypothetical protein